MPLPLRDRPPTRARKATRAFAFMDDFEIPNLSDTEVAIALVLGECPPGAMLQMTDGAVGSSSSSSSSTGVGESRSNAATPTTSRKALPCALAHSLHAVVHQATDVDIELERLRLSHTIRILKLPAYGDERLLLRAEDYANALAKSGCCDAAARVARQALPLCTGMHLHTAELQQALSSTGGDLDGESSGGGGKSSMHSTGGASCGTRKTTLAEARTICEALRKGGWLLAAHQAAHAEAHAAAPGEAPPLIDADVWLWSMPHAGRVLYVLGKCRNEVLKVLHKQHFHRAMLQVVERTAAVRKALTEAKLDLRHVVRDLVGKRLVEKTETTTGTVLELTPAGVQQAFNAGNSARKRRR